MNKLIASTLLMTSLTVMQVNAAEQNVALSELLMQPSENGIGNIEGIGQNVSGKKLKMIFVSFNLIKDGVVIGNAIASANNIEPNQKFTISSPYNSFKLKPDTFKVSDVTAH